MTLAATTVQTTGALTNGATTNFTFSFRVDAFGDIAAEDQLEVILALLTTGAETTLTKTTHYTVSVNGDQDSAPGGSITTVSTYAAGYKIYIRRNPSFLQNTDLQNQGAFNAATIETTFDQIVKQVQDLRDRQTGAPHFGVQKGSSFDGRIRGSLTGKGGYGLHVKEDLTGFELLAGDNSSPDIVTPTGAVAGRALANWFADEINVKADWGAGAAVGDGVTDDTAAISAAFEAAVSLGVKRVVFPDGRYVLSETIPVALAEGQPLTIDGIGDAILDVSGMPDDAAEFAIAITGPGAAGITTTATASFAKGDRLVAVASATNLAVGQWVRFTSTEYFYGKTGESGFIPKTKGEYNQIRYIDGLNVTFDRPFSDSYTVGGDLSEVVTLSVRQFSGPVEIKNLKLRGIGNGAAHTSGSPEEPCCIEVREARGVHFHHNEVSNFGASGVTIRDSLNVTVADNRLYGRDLTDASNAGLVQSGWFTQVRVASCQGFQVIDNHGRFNRHAVDIDSFTGGVICRHGLISNNVIEDCIDFGTHICDDVTIVGNSLTNLENGIVYRGKNPTIGINHLNGCGEAAVRIGAGGSSQQYTEDCNAGVIIIDGVTARKVGGNGIQIDVDADMIVLGKNTMPEIAGDFGVLIGGKNTGGLIERGGLYVRAGSSGGHGLHIMNETGGLRQSLDLLVVQGIYSNWARNIYDPGVGNSAAPQGPTIIDGIFLGATTSHINFGGSSSFGTPDNVAGWFGPSTHVRGFFDDTPGSSLGNCFEINYPNMYNTPTFDIARFEGVPMGYFWAHTGFSPTGNGRTVLRGHRIYHTDCAAGEPPYAVVVTPGTMGTLNSGATIGDMTSGQSVVAVNSVTGLGPGNYITIANAASGPANLATRIVSISGLNVTVADACSNTVTGAAISYTAPVLKNAANVAA